MANGAVGQVDCTILGSWQQLATAGNGLLVAFII
jgi:hypothetical protein